MKNNPESGEFCCLHICLFYNGKKNNSFSDDLDAPASSFFLVVYLTTFARVMLELTIINKEQANEFLIFTTHAKGLFQSSQFN